MRRCLVVANQTVGGDRLADAIRERAGDAEFFVVVPATPMQDQVGAPGTPTTKAPSAGEFARAVATQRLAEALAKIKAAGGSADGEVGDPDPLEAVREALARWPANEVIISTLPAGLSRWLRRGLPKQVEREFNLPVTHLVAEELTSR